MREVKILWVDDEWGNSVSPIDLSRAKNALEAEMLLGGIGAQFVIKSSDDVWSEFGPHQKLDLIILDYELSKDDKERNNGIELLDRLSSRLNSMPPVILFTRYSRRELESANRLYSSRRIHAIYSKDSDGAVDMVKCAARLLGSSPINFFVISDTHVGYLAETGGISQERFLKSLYESIEIVSREHKIEFMISCGDFAWKQQKSELMKSSTMLQNIAGRLKLGSCDQIAITPGNHDISFSSDGSYSWSSFSEFVDILSAMYPGFANRYTFGTRIVGNRPRFNDSTALFSLVHNERLGVVVVGLNSSKPTGNGYEVEPAIDDQQWDALTEELGKIPKEVLRIGILHHPIFSAPGGVYQDERALEDQGKALQAFANAGVSLVFHGHTHFSAVHSHRLAVINSPAALGQPGAVKIQNLLTVACPSLVAEPSSASPLRQYLIVSLGGADPDTGVRSFCLRSVVFDPATCSWSYGTEIPHGHFWVGGE
jgi:CheY-like chemotaxis protein